MAKYWEDNRVCNIFLALRTIVTIMRKKFNFFYKLQYYNAEVTGVSERTCVVQFKEFENYEEVLQMDCIPITEDVCKITQQAIIVLY